MGQKGAVTQAEKRKSEHKRKNSAHGSLFVILQIKKKSQDSRLPIMLFCGIALLGFAILFNNVATICEGKSQREQDRRSLFPYPHPARVLAKLV